MLWIYLKSAWHSAIAKPLHSSVNLCGLALGMGAAHGFELGDVFAHGPPHPTPKDERVLQAISSYWTNFAKTGNPNGPGCAPLPAFTRANQSVMNLGEPIVAREILPGDLRGLELLDAFFARQRRLVTAHDPVGRISN